VEEMAHVRMSVKVVKKNLKVCLQGKWTHRIPGKIESSDLMELKRAKSGFQNKEFPYLMGWNRGMSGCQENKLPNLLELKGDTTDCRKG